MGRGSEREAPGVLKMTRPSSARRGEHVLAEGAARAARGKGTRRAAGFEPGSQGSRAVPHGESKWQEEAGRPGRASSTQCPPGVRWFVVYQSIVERGQERPDKVEGVLGKAQARTEEVSGAVTWTDVLVLNFEHAIGLRGYKRE
jgi:hypothetical protein